MDSSPFNRSARTARTPPPTPGAAPADSPLPPGQRQDAPEMEVVSTAELHSWMTKIEQCLNEINTTAVESKMNSDQKARVNNMCLKVASGTSQIAVMYQSLKYKALQAQSTIKNLNDQLALSQHIKELKVSIDKASKPSVGTSFADMVKNGTNKFIQPIQMSSVAIYPNDKLKSSEETKNLVQSIIRPEEMKLHVRGLRKTKNGGVIISTETKEDIEKLKQSVQLSNSGFTLDEPQKRKPRVVVIGVPSTMQESEVFTCLYKQNLADKLQDSNLVSFLASIRLSHKSGKKNAETCNYVIEVPAVIRKHLIENGRVFVNWSSCPVRDFTLVTRCYKCQQYGHAAKTCREANYTCGHCGEQGHQMKDCTTTAEQPKCATCLHFKKPSNHKTGDVSCPAKLMAEKRFINSIDYGGA